jgi:hypothetical protein
VSSDDLRATVREAITRVRREALKAAAVHAVVYGALAALAVNLALTALGLDLPGPSYTRQALAAAVGVAVLVAVFVRRTRTPLVEQFEAVNPSVAEALRTARDTVADGTDSRVARRLYRDVLDRLSRASSQQLVDTGRVALAVVLVLGLSLATIQVSAVGLDLTPPQSEPTAPTDPPRDDEYDGLEDGEAILGEEENVTSGDDDLDAVVGGASGGSGDVEERDRSFESGGFSSEGAFDAQRAGFSTSDDVENADIIREYNLRIRDDDTDTENE